MTHIPQKYLQIKKYMGGWVGFKRLGSLIVAHMATNSAFYSSSYLSENEHHNYITSLDQELMTCLWFVGVSSFQKVIYQCCTDLSTTCISIYSPWLSIQQGCQGLVQTPEPHLKLGKPSRTALQGHKLQQEEEHCELQQEEEHQNWLAIYEKVFSMPALSALKQDYFFPPKQLHKNGSLCRLATSSRCRICLLTSAERFFYLPLPFKNVCGETSKQKKQTLKSF